MMAFSANAFFAKSFFLRKKNFETREQIISRQNLQHLRACGHKDENSLRSFNIKSQSVSIRNLWWCGEQVGGCCRTRALLFDTVADVIFNDSAFGPAAHRRWHWSRLRTNCAISKEFRRNKKFLPDWASMSLRRVWDAKAWWKRSRARNRRLVLPVDEKKAKKMSKMWTRNESRTKWVKRRGDFKLQIPRETFAAMRNKRFLNESSAICYFI